MEKMIKVERKNIEGKLISKAQFREQTEEMMINYKCNNTYLYYLTY